MGTGGYTTTNSLSVDIPAITEQIAMTLFNAVLFAATHFESS